jgi:hypothetical protein
VNDAAASWVTSHFTLQEWRDSRIYKWIVLILVWSLSAFYVSGFYDRGWVPHDEGGLAQSAERVLIGELPHRDFDEIYSGGLTFLHALAFKLAGVNLITPRVVLLLFFLAFVPAVYLIALRFARPEVSALVTILAIAWSVPNYFASVPSWYNLFFAVFGTLTLIWHIETGMVRWLFVAGLLGGLSILIKIVGLYYLAAGVLFLLFREQQLARPVAAETRHASRWYFFLKAIGLAIFVSLLIAMLRGRLGVMELLHFILPQIAISGVILRNEWDDGHGPLSARIRNLLRLIWPFLAGATFPIALFVGIYLWNDSIADLYRGIFILPQKRMASAAADFPPAATIITSLPYAALVFYSFPAAQTHLSRVIGGILISMLGAALLFSDSNLLYYTVWQSARSLGVVAVLAGGWFLSRPGCRRYLPDNTRQALFLVLSMTALFGLIQFPFAGPLYFIYTTPLVCLGLLALITARDNMPKLRHMVALLFYLFFAVFWKNGLVWATGVAYVPFRTESPLKIDRGPLRVIDEYNRIYTELVNFIRLHSTSRYIYAAPDCPEVYFLSGKQNPTRAIFDFLNDGENEPERIANLLNDKRINLVVMNSKPQFSKTIDPELSALIENRFRLAVHIGHFTVRWKE